TLVGNHYALTTASAPSTGLTVLSGIQEHKGLVNSDTLWYFAINLRRADTVFQSDTTDPIVLKITIPYKYRKEIAPGVYSTINSYLKFDSLLIDNIGNKADIDYYSRGRWMDSKLVAVDSDTVIIIRRSMVPKFSDTCDVTLSAFFKTIELKSKTKYKPNPPFRLREYVDNQLGRIDSFDIRIEYFPTCNVNINWVRLETPNARKTFRGHWDKTMAIWFTHNVQGSIRRMQDSVPNLRLWRYYSLDEPKVFQYLYVRYLNRFFNRQTHTEGGGSEQYMHCTEQPTTWFAVPKVSSLGNPAPYIPYVLSRMENATKHDSAYYANFEDKHFYALRHRYGFRPVHHDRADAMSAKKWFIFDSLYGGDRYGGSYELFTNMTFSDTIIPQGLATPLIATAKSWNSSPASTRFHRMAQFPRDPSMQLQLEAGMYYYYYLNPHILYGKPWYSYINFHGNIEAQYVEEKNRKYARNNNARVQTGEEVRLSLWYGLIFGTKGLLYDRFHSDALVDIDTAIAHKNQGNYDLWNTMRTVQGLFFGCAMSPPYQGITQAHLYNEQLTVGDSILKSNAIGSDFLVQGDASNMDDYIHFDSTATILGISKNRIYMGRKSIRHEVCKVHDYIHKIGDTLMNIELMGWYGKGFRELVSSRNNDTSLMHSIFSFNSSRLMTIATVRRDLRDGWDTTYLDITLLRHKDTANIPMTKEFYVGIINRRTNPLIRNSQTGDTLQFFSTSEFDSLTTSTTSFWQQQRYKQGGARMITLPFNVQASNNHYALLRVTELGADDPYLDSVYNYRNNPALYQKIDTVIGQDKSVMVKLLPGEGKIFRVRVQYPDRFTGDLSHSNQTKLVAHSIMRHDSVQNKWVEGDSVVYHAVYHKKIVGASARTGVYYRVSKPIAMASNTNALQWHNEILLSDSVEHHNRINLNDNCAYPALIVRFDSTMNTYNSFIVYGCTSSYSGDGTPFIGQHIVESIVALRRDTIINTSHGVSIDTVHSNVLSDYGTPMINASDSVNFYVYSCAQRGIIAGWKKPRVIDRFLVNTVNFRFTHPLNCYDPVFDARHPSLNPYSRYLRGQKENDCIVVWQEKNTCVPRENIFTTRLRVQNDTIVYGLSPNFDIPTPYSVLFKHDSTIFCSSTMTQSFDTVLSHHFPVVYRELWHADDSSAYCHFQTYYPGHTTTDFHLDRVVWEVHQGGSAVNFLSDRGHWFYDTTIAGTMQPNRFGVGWLGHLWMGAYSYPMPISPPASLDQPSISAGTAAYFKDYPPVNWYGCVNSYTQRAMNLTFRHQAGGVTSIFSLPQTHAYPPIREFVQMIDHNNVTQSHVAARGSVLLNDWWRNHRIYNKTVDNGIVLDPYQIRSSGQHYYRFGQDNALRSLSVASFGNENGSFGIGTPSINDEEYMLYPYSTMPQRMEHPYYQTIDTLATAWFRVGDDEQLRYSFSGSNPQQATAYLERKSDGAQWILPSMPLREYTLSRLELTLFNGNEEEYRIVTYGNENTSFIRNTALVYDNEEMSKISGHTLTLNLDELPMQQQSIRLYPNPANDELSVAWSGGKA
ncbi:MAG TPA: hypothetical protein PLW09_16255, partial [Candidatus Kapabacteria bacterium]|nr:hypothetical protein [Candidatus Kapabacteria bacterium]